ncbi:MAG: Hpt domain-containing protein [Planctomycetota bacterium]|jgi:PAS domain S-box-containing protein
MSRTSARSRIVIGLVMLLVSVMLGASTLGLVPDRTGAVIAGRAQLCEAIAIASSAYVSHEDETSLKAFLQAIVHRNRSVLSAAIRRTDGQRLVEVGDHAAHWGRDGATPDSQVYVPIYANDQRWGAAEIRFKSATAVGLLGRVLNDTTVMIVFVAMSCFLVYSLYLRKVLQHLDPSKVIPPRVRSALDTLAEGLLLMDTSERVVHANKAFADTVGLAPDQLRGRQASRLPWRRPDEDEDDAALPWQSAISENEPSMGTLLGLESPDEGAKTFLVNSCPVHDDQGKPRGALASFEDVTLLEEHKVNLARMSHEIRTPMNAVLGFTDLLRRGLAESEAEQAEYLNTIHASGTHLLDLINDILDLSKVEAGQMEIESQEVSLHELISGVVTVLRVRAQEKGIVLGYEWDGPVPETIQTDPTRFKQILTNLIGNAIKFTEEGAVRVVARMERAGSRRFLAVDVVDSGIGMSPATLARIFDPFVQAEASITRRFGGTGLGLSISRRLAQALGGTIQVQSTEGEGSTFSLLVQPGSLKGVRMLTEMPAVTAPAAGPSGAAVQTMIPGARVLVVDDGASNRKLFAIVLRRAGAIVECVENGQEAIDRIEASTYDLVLMDMQMPVMDGYRAARTLRERGFDLPIIALTANAMKGDEQKCLDAGCSGFLPKPIDLDRLVATIGQVLGYDEVEQPAVPSATVTAPAAASSAGPLVSTLLATGDPELREIVQEFVGRLGERFDEMRQAWARHDLGTLAEIAHWLKGSGPTVGFADFEAPAARLEQLSRAGAVGEIEDALQTIEHLVGRVRTDPAAVTAASTNRAPTAASTSPLVSTLPMDDPEFREIVEEFVAKLGERIRAMRHAWETRDLDELARLAHWLKGTGPTAGFAALADPSAALEQAAREQAEEAVEDALRSVERIAGCIRSAAGEDSASSGADSAPPAPAPLRSKLPTDDPEFCEIVAEFVDRLQMQFADLRSAWADGEVDELARLAHWLKGAGGTAGFPELTESAARLEALVRECGLEGVQSAVEELTRLVESVEAPVSPQGEAAADEPDLGKVGT